jgi:TonB family protein
VKSKSKTKNSFLTFDGRRLNLAGMIEMTVLALSLFFSSCAASQETASPAATPITPDYVSYLKMIQKKVHSTWKYPTGISGTHTVTLRFVLDIDGKLVSAEVVESTDARLNSSAIEAINRASPFSRIPEDLKRLAGEPMVMKFTVIMTRRETP